MRKFLTLALGATLVLATAGLAIAGGPACESSAKAETASASGCASEAKTETAAVKTASADCASKTTAETAAAKTASASCATSATAQTASADCASKTAVQTAGADCASKATAETAGAECSSKASTAAKTVQLETVRMPSGAMAVFYNGTNAETVAYLQSAADAGCAGFVCDMAKSMAADANVATEIAKTEHGVMILVTAKDSTSVDPYEEQYAAVVASMSDEQGE